MEEHTNTYNNENETFLPGRLHVACLERSDGPNMGPDRECYHITNEIPRL